MIRADDVIFAQHASMTQQSGHRADYFILVDGRGKRAFFTAALSQHCAPDIVVIDDASISNDDTSRQSTIIFSSRSQIAVSHSIQCFSLPAYRACIWLLLHYAGAAITTCSSPYLGLTSFHAGLCEAHIFTAAASVRRGNKYFLLLAMINICACT